MHVFDWLKDLFSPKNPADGQKQGMITRTCRECGKTFTLPENVQHWPDLCQACRAKYHPSEMITRTCRGCGQFFTFPSDLRKWPKYCPDCQAGRKGRA